MLVVGSVILWVVCEFRHVGAVVGCAPSYNYQCGVLCYLQMFVVTI